MSGRRSKLKHNIIYYYDCSLKGLRKGNSISDRRLSGKDFRPKTRNLQKNCQNCQSYDYFKSMNIKTNIINNGERSQILEVGCVNKVGDGSFKEHTVVENNINVAQNTDIREPSAQKLVSAAEFDVHGLIEKQGMHDSLSCATCNLYLTKRATSHGSVISGEPEVARMHVKRVINEQHVHDLCCLSCNSYITKRAILHRRAISPDEEVILPVPGHMILQMLDLIERNTLECPTSEVCRLDIIKAVVYGGLLQFITSLSVIVSAAGGDASTLNIVALALANAFGGLLVLGHNLRKLKQEQNTEHYGEQLGRPGHFLLHAFIAIISYLFFGLMPPITYGFSFYKSDNKYLKLATLAAVSLICITLLSTGKAYVQRPPKAYMKTVLSYISLGIMVAGPGYVAGDLANMLLKKLEVFDSLSSGSTPVIQANVVKGPWSTY